MKRTLRLASGVAAAALLVGSLAACGSSGPARTGSGSSGGGGGGGGGGQSQSSTGTTSSGGGGGGNSGGGGYAPGGTLKVLMGTSPDSLDPDYGYTAQAAEADWIVYTPLLTYTRASGTAGTKIIPGLAESLPTISDGGKTYTLTMRKGLKFSNGKPVVASDFAYGIERAIKISWGGASFFTGNIQGAAAYQAGKAKSISGIVTNDKTGKIVIHLTAPYGAFENVLSFPAAAPVPAGTAMKPLTLNPPPGVGPYEITAVKENVDFTLKKNPYFAGFHIPNIPLGYVNNIDVTIESNNNTETQMVLDNQADEFDWSDTIAGSYLQQVQTQAKSRYTPETLAGTDYFFMNTRTKPFNNIKAREAVNLAISRVALARLAGGQITPACYFLPPGIPGHVSGPCSFGSATATGSPADIAKAKKLVDEAGLKGTPVTVWSETRQPRQAYSTYLNGQLNAIGFKSSLRVISDSIYFQTIGSAKTNPQIGFADWFQDFPNPGDFYLLLDARAIAPINNENFGNTDDPHIQSTIKKLERVPASKLDSVASQWQALEKYVSSKYYMAPYGYLIGPLFLSDRVDYSKAIFQPLYGDDWTSFELKK